MDAGRRGRPAVRGMVTIVVIVLLALFLLTPAVQGFLRELVSSPFQPRYPEYATFTLKREMVVGANGGEVLDFAFDIPEPTNVSENGYDLQEVTGVSYSPAVSWSGIRYGQEWVQWNGTSFSGQSTRTCSATYQVTVRTHIWSIDGGSSATVTSIPAAMKSSYLQDEWKINLTAPQVVATSKAIVGTETNVYLILKDIYDWMTANIRYPSASGGGEPQSAVETLQSKVGDCDDQSILFCSLARAAGVPAWLQLGALYVNVENTWGGHAWLQAYIPLKSGGGENVTIDIVNKDFLVFRPNRFIDFTDDGNADHLTDYYYTFFSHYDPTTYPDGKVPTYSEDYIRLSYEESSKKISAGSSFLLDHELMLADNVRAISRR